NATVVSAKAFDSLDKATQDAVLKAAAEAEARGWRTSEQKDNEFVKELAAKGMRVAAPSDALRKGLQAIGQTMTTDWIKSAGAEGIAVVEAYRK
ncbi:MAG: C4-dicarboxylate ABC transporter substrate-binding protein, partial [Polaromonas sp.]